MKNFFMFDLLITPWIVRILYLIGQIVLIIACFAIAEDAFRGSEEITMGILFSIISIPLWRIICESWIVLFRISENISKVALQDVSKSPLSISKTQKVLFSNVENPDLFINQKAFDPKTKYYIGKIVKIDVENGKCTIKKDVGGETEMAINEIMVSEL